jgi:uncharacterized DUF497 family protein
MMEITELQWDDDNVSYIARHNVNPEEVEDVFSNNYFVSKDPMVKSGVDDNEQC